MAEERPGYPYGTPARAMLLCLAAYTTSTFPPQLGPHERLKNVTYLARNLWRSRNIDFARGADQVGDDLAQAKGVVAHLYNSA